MSSVFKIQLSSFELKQKRRGEGKLLRFTLSWRLDTPNPNPELSTVPMRIGASIRGCMAYVSVVTGELYWHPSQLKVRNSYQHYITVTPDLYAEVKRLISESPYYHELAPPKHLIWKNNYELMQLEDNRTYDTVEFEQEYLNE